MFKIVILRGGLGNQMFGYAFFLYLKNKYSCSYILLDLIDSFNYNLNSNFLFRTFTLPHSFHHKFNRIIRKFYYKYPTTYFFKFISEEALGNYEFLTKTKPGIFTVYNGFWQSYKFVDNIESYVRETLKFDLSKLNLKTKDKLKEIRNKESVAIHVRRGDYLENEMLKDICNIDYFVKAISIISTYVDNPVYYLFSDDLVWTQKNINFIPNELIDFNNGEDSWQDMFLMSQCKHNIISNSSFSWWAAWFNTNPTKVVITPKRWINHYETPEIIPDKWIKI